MRNVMASATEAELVRLFENFQKLADVRNFIAEMGHQQTTTLMVTDNTLASHIFNGTAKRKRYQAIDMIFYWVRDRI